MLWWVATKIALTLLAELQTGEWKPRGFAGHSARRGTYPPPLQHLTGVINSGVRRPLRPFRIVWHCPISMEKQVTYWKQPLYEKLPTLCLMLAIGGGVVTMAVLQRPSSQHPFSVALYLLNILMLSAPLQISSALPVQGIMVQPSLYLCIDICKCRCA